MNSCFSIHKASLHTRFASICFLLLLLTPVLKADELRILTSMAPSFFEPFVEAFKQFDGDTEVLVLNKNTNAALEEILRGNQRHFDIFWASSVEAFAVLAAHQQFSALPDSPDQLYLPFAFSSIGWVQKRDNDLPRPEEWDDLLKPVYAGKIAMARPSRSGTNHMFVERFLQVRGWNEGWQYLLQFSGSLSTITSRSFSVLDGVAHNRFALGISIDFLSHTQADNALNFRYGKPVIIMPAHIARLNSGHAPQAAQQFIRFIRSEQGQKMLLQPNIRRVPVSPSIRAQASGELMQEIKDALRLTWQPYDAELAKDRYWAVNILFDTFITHQLPRRQKAWDKLRQLRSPSLPVHAEALGQVQRLLTQMPVTETQASALALNHSLNRVTSLQTPNTEQKKALETWTVLADEALSKAEAILRTLEHEPKQAGKDD